MRSSMPTALLALVTGGCLCAVSEAGEKEQRVLVELDLLSQSAERFAQRAGRLPLSVEEMSCDAGCELAQVPKDPWGTAYRQFSQGDASSFESAGPDRKWRTPDDARSRPLRRAVVPAPGGCFWVDDHCYRGCTADWECQEDELCLCLDKQRCLVPTRATVGWFAPSSDVCVRAPTQTIDYRRRRPDAGTR